MRKLLLIVALGIAFARGATAAPKAPVPDTLGLSTAGTEAVRTLLDVEFFSGWAIGIAGTPSPGVAALRTLLQEQNAAKALAYVRTHATLAGQLMALAGLYDADPAEFKRALPAYTKLEDGVRVWESGCIMGSAKKVADIVVAQNAIQTGGPGKPITSWPSGSVLDIAGGGYSAMMRRPKRSQP